jgi:hypothetical protein
MAFSGAVIGAHLQLPLPTKDSSPLSASLAELQPVTAQSSRFVDCLPAFLASADLLLL